MSNWRYDIDDMDWEEFANWPIEVEDEYWRAIEAFEDGNPAPLGDYLGKGYRLTYQMAHRLRQAIAGGGPVKLVLEQVAPDRQAHSSKLARYYRNIEIGAWIEKRLRADSSLKYGDAVDDAAKHFGIGKETAKRALSDLRRQLQGDFEGFPNRDPVAIAEHFPEYWKGENPVPKRRVRPK